MKSQRFQLLFAIFVAFLLLATMPALAQYNRVTAFSFVTNNGAITITGYTAPVEIGPGGHLDIPDSTNGYPVTGIGTYAFFDCNPTSVTIPDSITNISEGAFGYCLFLTNITVGVGNPSYASLGGLLFDRSMSLLMQYPAGLTDDDYVIPGSVNRIGTDAFAGCYNLASVTIPTNVTSIGDWAFYDCFRLTNMMMLYSVTNIGIGAFNGCSSLMSVTLPNSITSISKEAFAGCSSLTNVTMGNSVTSIGIGAFYGSGLTQTTVPNSVTNIAAWAFWSCSSLTNIYFLGNAPTTDSTAFSDDNLATAYYLPNTAGWNNFFNTTGVSIAPWLPDVQLGVVQTNGFGFNISWASGQTVVVEACTNLFSPNWQPVQTNTLTTGSTHFSDTQWTNYPNRFYRIRSP